jgi:hypothetical protein
LSTVIGRLSLPAGWWQTNLTGFEDSAGHVLDSIRFSAHQVVLIIVLGFIGFIEASIKGDDRTGVAAVDALREPRKG